MYYQISYNQTLMSTLTVIITMRTILTKLSTKPLPSLACTTTKPLPSLACTTTMSVVCPNIDLSFFTFLDSLELQFDVIALTEVGKYNVKSNAVFKDYKLYHDETKTMYGGTAILVNTNVEVLSERDD